MKIASWSKKYYEGLTEAQHKANDEWFESKRKLLNYTGVLIVPNLQKSFNRHGEEIKNDWNIWNLLVSTYWIKSYNIGGITLASISKILIV